MGGFVSEILLTKQFFFFFFFKLTQIISYASVYWSSSSRFLVESSKLPKEKSNLLKI